jgi:hypothetical protein
MSEDVSTRLRWGANVTAVAGAIPCLFGLVTIAFLWWSHAHPDEPWRAGMPPGSRASFSLADVRACNAQLADEVVSAKYVQYSSLFAVGIVIMALAQFGLKQRQRWSFWLLMVTILLVGWNDGVTTLVFDQAPIPFVPAGLATLGLLIARPEIFGPSARPHAG